MFNLSSFFFTMSVSDSVANNLIACQPTPLVCFFLNGVIFYFFSEVTFVEKKTLNEKNT